MGTAWRRWSDVRTEPAGFKRVSMPESLGTMTGMGMDRWPRRKSDLAGRSRPHCSKLRESVPNDLTLRIPKALAPVPGSYATGRRAFLLTQDPGLGDISPHAST